MEKDCRRCGRVFSKKEVPERFCSRKCAMKAAGMKPLVLSLVLMISTIAANAQILTCREIVNGFALVPMQKISVRYRSLSRKRWYRTDVLLVLDRDRCGSVVRETVYRYRGHRLTKWATFDDPCDGGNVYGVLLDRHKRPIAHIYDSDYYCREHWRPEYISGPR